MNPENKQILLILDLDETLIHARKEKLAYEPNFQIFDYFVYIRPGVNEFLIKMQELYKLAIWSSATNDYVTEIIKEISPADIEYEFIWGRSRCTFTRDIIRDKYIYQKKLKKVRRLGFPLDQILIIDDSPQKLQSNYGNAIYIKPFRGDKKDKELKYLAEYLLSLKERKNLRRLEKRNWRSKFIL